MSAKFIYKSQLRFYPVSSQTTADLHNELAKENIQILASETFAEDPTAQVKSLKVSYYLT